MHGSETKAGSSVASSAASPFIKWAGGKRSLAAEIIRRFPMHFNAYHEPFVGGGAVYWSLPSWRMRGKAFLSDTNLELVRTYRAVRYDVEGVIRELSELTNDRETFERLRELDPKGLPDAALTSNVVSIAPWFIFLNKTCFNGLWRVNRSGKFNVPFADNGNSVLDEDGLRRCSAGLQRRTWIDHAPFQLSLERIKLGDLVYCDPPYPPLSKTSNFTSYTTESFSWDDHVRLRDEALALKRQGVHVVLSNSDQPRVRELYREGFTIEEVSARRNINSKGNGRGQVGELIIT